MINILLEAYIAKAEIKRKIHRGYMAGTIIATILVVVLILLYEFQNCMLFLIFSLLSIIALYVVIALWERDNLKRYNTQFKEHNKRLDIIKKILIEFSYDDNKNWYSAEKIQYLIQSGELSLEERKNTDTRLFDLGKTIFFPIIGFVAGVISDKANLNEIIGITIIALLVLIISVSLAKILSFVTDLILKSSSINEMNSLILLLKDLYSRDFD